MKTPTHGIVVLASALALAGCAHSGASQVQTGQSPASNPLSLDRDPTDQRIADNGPAPAESQPTLTDDQILGVTTVANGGEVAQGQLALSKARDPRVKSLASMMVHDHTAAQTKSASLARAANLTPTTSSVADAIQHDGNAVTQSLKAAGQDFDKVYVDAQVKEHQAVLDILDQQLIPNVKNADVKAYLVEVRSTVSKHLQHAKELQQTLGK